MQKKKRIALIWLRNDLRVSDHLGFYKASKNVIKYLLIIHSTKEISKKLVGVLKNRKI